MKTKDSKQVGAHPENSKNYPGQWKENSYTFKNQGSQEHEVTSSDESYENVVKTPGSLGLESISISEGASDCFCSIATMVSVSI